MLGDFDPDELYRIIFKIVIKEFKKVLKNYSGEADPANIL
jgi:hypothetical protein